LFSRAVAASSLVVHNAQSGVSGGAGDVGMAPVPIRTRLAAIPGSFPATQELVAVYEMADSELAPILLKYALPTEVVLRREVAVVIVLDGSSLTTTAQQLDRWIQVLTKHMTVLNLAPDDQRSLIMAMKERWVKFVEANPVVEKNKKAEEEEEKKKQKVAATKAEEKRPVPTSFAAIASAGPIEEEPEDEADPVISAAALTDALQDCLGVPVTIVLSKADIAASVHLPQNSSSSSTTAASNSSLAQRLAHADDGDIDDDDKAKKKNKVDEVVTMANVLSFVRAAALRIGASVVFASGKTQKNVDALLATLSSVLFGSANLPRHQVYEYATAFVPAGWDSVKKLALDVTDQDKLMSDLRAVAEKAQNDAAEISAVSSKQETCMSDEDFLQRMLGAISEFQASDAAVSASSSSAGTNLGTSTRLGGRDEQAYTPMRMLRASARSSAARSLASSIRRTSSSMQHSDDGSQDFTPVSPSSSQWHRTESSSVF